MASGEIDKQNLHFQNIVTDDNILTLPQPARGKNIQLPGWVPHSFRVLCQKAGDGTHRGN
jgi:hypothetical protein